MEPTNEVTREQANHVYGICYKYLSEKMMETVRDWYEDMAKRCAEAAARLKNKPPPVDSDEPLPTQHQLMLTLLRTCAFQVGVDATAKQGMTDRFIAFTTAHFGDCKQVYQQLFVSKSRLLASPIVVSSSEQRAKFRVPACDAFLAQVLVETAKIAIAYVDFYQTPDAYEKNSHKISVRFVKTIKGVLNSMMPAWTTQAQSQPTHAAALPDGTNSAAAPDATTTPSAMAIDVPPLTSEQTQILASESAAAAAAAPLPLPLQKTRRLNFEPDQSWT